mmetsp:Transcript_253/g.380  ORF Transcript_253/g.380 Transcript_253/m.380 type:complete len:165 (-) Transcript_253:161-655(-)
MWGRTKTRWIDVTGSSTEGFGVDDKEARRIFDSKLNMVERCRDRWPAFATYEEDKEYSEEKFRERYDGHRPIFWDMTNITIPKPGESRMQRVTYSSYYAQNCFKGGIGVQTCGWIRTHDLWTGCVSDTACNLHLQKAIQDSVATRPSLLRLWRRIGAEMSGRFG